MERYCYFENNAGTQFDPSSSLGQCILLHSPGYAAEIWIKQVYLQEA